MRNFINIMEDAFANAVKALVPHDSKASAGWGYDIDGQGYEITDQHVSDMREKITSTLKTNPMIYRFILLRPADLAKYLSGPLGVYWCHEYDQVPLDALTGWDSAPTDAELYLLTAVVNPASVDMERTVLQNLAVPWESEIKVNAGSPLRLVSVGLLPDADQNARQVKQPFPPHGRYTA